MRYYSKQDKAEYAKKMQEIESFCKDNKIESSLSGDSYYFRINDLNYRVSNHTVKASNKGMYDKFGRKIRDSYHKNDDVICITASKTRIIQIYNDLKAGKKLNKRGIVI